jgi:hypothetical protein
MLKLTAIFFIVIAPTLAGIFATIPLSMAGTLDFDPNFFLAFVVAGVVLAIPVSWYVAKRVDAMISRNGPAATA